MLSSSKGFALISAIITLLVVASIVSLNFTTSGASKYITKMQYFKTAAYFFEVSAKNIVEKKLNSYDFTSSCLEHLELDFGKYLSVVDIFYIGKNLPCSAKYILDNNSSADLNLSKIVNIKTIVKGENISSFTRYNLF